MCPDGHKNEVNRYATISEKSNLLPNLKAQAVLYLYTKRHLLKLIRTNKEEDSHTLTRPIPRITFTGISLPVQHRHHSPVLDCSGSQ